MNNKLEALRKEFLEDFKCINNECDGKGNIPVLVAGTRQISETEFEQTQEWEAEQCQFCFEHRFPVAEFFLSRFATIMDEVVESIVPEEKEVGHILECNMCSPKCGWNSAIATIKNNYKEIRG